MQQPAKHDIWLREGWKRFRSQKYWEAHESWEALWLDLPKASRGRLRTRALIQITAAFYKPEQAHEGRPLRRMQRGMSALLTAARKHLDQAANAPPPTIAIDSKILDELLTRATNYCHQWHGGKALLSLRRELASQVQALPPEPPPPSE